MKRKYFVLISIIFIISIFTSLYLKTDTESKTLIKNNYKRISVVIDDNYPPYVFRNSEGRAQGILIDEWKLWQERTGIDVEINAMSWDAAQKEMKAGKYDVIDTIFSNSEREALYDFSKPYAQIDSAIFFSRNISGINNIESLKGFSVAVKRGDNSIPVLREKGITNIKEYDSYEDIINAAREKEIMVFIMDKPPALYYMYKTQLESYFNFTNPLYTGEFHRAVKKGNTELLKVIENGFDLISDDEYKAIEKKWYGIETYNEKNSKYLTYAEYAAAAATVVILILVIWSSLLKKMVGKKTSELVSAMAKLSESEKKYREVLMELNFGIALFSTDGSLLLSNRGFKDLVGVNKEGVPNSPEKVIVYDENGKIIKQKEFFLDKILPNGEPIYDLTLGLKVEPESPIKWVKFDAVPVLDSNNNVQQIIGAYVDITEKINMIDALSDSENKIRAIVKAIPDLVFIINSDAIFLDYLSEDNGKEYYPREYFIDKCAYDIFPADIADGFKKSIDELNRTGIMQIYEYPLEINGDVQHFEIRFLALGENRILSLVRDITKRRIDEKKIYEMSVYDTLTGLYNRNYFEKEIARLENEKTINTGLVICDIDGLKLINDTMGHSMGDEYIAVTSKILKSCFGENDIIARIGGDEFAVLIKDTNEEEIDSIKRNVKIMTDSLNDNKSLIPISLSLGYSIVKDETKTINDIFKEADDYMYREKLYNLQSPRSRNIELIIKMLEARDFLTEDHGERIKKLASDLAAAIGMSKNEIKDIKLLAQFHDIGKIGIPDSILFKPQQLTKEEKIIMRRHTDIGYRIAQTSPDIMHISEWILKHHEYWDGSGYPFGLKGEEIPVQCRILSIADSYDAMTNDRPYRKAMSKEEAVEEIEKNLGYQFDPRLGRIFIDNLQNQ